ncbi:exo-alpha-sialidase [Puteibacter caeruleilacunae]|nr:exo-alpha-sialidase [Puteibacter caeruleilacunae]
MKKNHLLFLFTFLGIWPFCPSTKVIAQEEMKTTELFSPGLAGITEYRIPSLISTPKGTLIAMVDARVDRRGDIPNNVDLAIRRSSDNGETWGNVEVIVDYGKPEGYDITWGAADAAMVYDKETLTLWALYTMGQGVGIRQSQAGFDGHTCQIHAIYSKDEGASWSDPIDITKQCKRPSMKFFGTAPGVGIQTKDGELVFCIYTTDEANGGTMTPYLIISDDHGDTWRLSATWGDEKTSVTETQLVELKDGTWMVNSRNHYGRQHRAIATSNDKGKSWSDIQFDNSLACPTCMASLISIPHPKKKKKQLLVFSNPDSIKGRKNGTVKVSDDEGKTWKWSKNITKGGYGYSCLTQLKDGSIGLFYETEKSRLNFVKLSLEYLTDGNYNVK